MKVLVPVRPEAFLDLTWSNIPQNSPGVLPWASGNAYAVGDQVRVDTIEYQAAVETTGDNPSSNPNVWVPLGRSNRWKPFDSILSTQAVGGTGGGADQRAEATITYPSSINAVAVFNTNARTIQVRIRDADGSSIAYRGLSMLDDTPIASWLDYFYEPVTFRSEGIIEDLPGFTGTSVQVTIIPPPGQVARVGQIVVGRATSIGELLEDAQIGIQDFSRKERDDWGNPIIVERPFAQRADIDLAIPSQDARSVQRLLASIRATPAVYYDRAGSDDFGTTIFGYYTDFSVSLRVGEYSYLNLEIEGLV